MHKNFEDENLPCRNRRPRFTSCTADVMPDAIAPPSSNTYNSLNNHSSVPNTRSTNLFDLEFVSVKYCFPCVQRYTQSRGSCRRRWIWEVFRVKRNSIGQGWNRLH